MKKFIALTAIAIALASCGAHNGKSDSVAAEQQEKLSSEALRQSGMPAIVNFQERKFMKRIIEQRDQANVMNYAYLFAEQTGKLIYLGRCIGYGLPYATQYTNPMKVIRFADDSYCYSGQNPQTMPQADPNGLFMPQSAEGTWLLMVNPKTNKEEVCYFEPKIIVSPYPLSTEGVN